MPRRMHACMHAWRHAASHPTCDRPCMHAPSGLQGVHACMHDVWLRARTPCQHWLWLWLRPPRLAQNLAPTQQHATLKGLPPHILRSAAQYSTAQHSTVGAAAGAVAASSADEGASTHTALHGTAACVASWQVQAREELLACMHAWMGVPMPMCARTCAASHAAGAV